MSKRRKSDAKTHHLLQADLRRGMDTGNERGSLWLILMDRNGPAFGHLWNKSGWNYFGLGQ